MDVDTVKTRIEAGALGFYIEGSDYVDRKT